MKPGDRVTVLGTVVDLGGPPVVPEGCIALRLDVSDGVCSVVRAEVATLVPSPYDMTPLDVAIEALTDEVATALKLAKEAESASSRAWEAVDDVRTALAKVRKERGS